MLVHRRRCEYLVLPRVIRFLRTRFALRLLVCRWRLIVATFLLIAGPVLLAMWVVPYSAGAVIKVKWLDSKGYVQDPMVEQFGRGSKTTPLSKVFSSVGMFR